MSSRNGATSVRDLEGAIGGGWAQLAAMHAQTLASMEGLVQVLNADLRQRKAVEGQAELAVIEEEYQTVQNAAQIILTPKSSNYFLVTQITWALPGGATGVLFLGDRQIPLPLQMYSMGARILLSPNDARQLQISASGQAFLHLGGTLLSPQTWLH